MRKKWSIFRVRRGQDRERAVAAIQVSLDPIILPLVRRVLEETAEGVNDQLSI